MTMIHKTKMIIVLVISVGLLGTTALVTRTNKALRASKPVTTKHDVWVGDTLPTLLNYSWKEHDHSLVLAARVECSHCRASVPFYRQLQSMVASTTNRVGVVAVFPNPPDKVRTFLEQFNLDIPVVSNTPLEQLAVSGTPTLILADSVGTVVRVWVGELDAKERRELLAQLRLYLDGNER